MTKQLTKKDTKGALLEKLDKIISMYEKREQELLFLGSRVRRLGECIAKLESK